MKQTLSPLELRGQAGRERRKAVPRGELALTHAGDRDPVEMTRASAQGRVEALVALRNGRMLASPLAFFRGTANLQAPIWPADRIANFTFRSAATAI